MKEDEDALQLRDAQTAVILASRSLSWRQVARRVVPRSIRVERVRLKRYPGWLIEHAFMASPSDRPVTLFPHVWSQRHSPLCRPGVEVSDTLQRGKETNVRRAVSLLQGTLIAPGQTFSYHHVVGRPSYRRGFVDGPELHNQALSSGVGGGCCQVTNMLYQLALLAGLEIVERHRHSLDLFADAGRTVPFGCGATVFYNRADLRFRNPFDCSIFINLQIEQGILTGQLRSAQPSTFWVEVFDKDHAFFQQRGHWFRQNTLCRRFISSDGALLDVQDVESNLATTLYVPEFPDQILPEMTLRSDHCLVYRRRVLGLLSDHSG